MGILRSLLQGRVMNISFFPIKTSEVSQVKNLLSEASNLSQESLLSNSQSSFASFMKGNFDSSSALENKFPTASHLPQPVSFQESSSFKSYSSSQDTVSESNEYNANNNTSQSLVQNPSKESEASENSEEISSKETTIEEAQLESSKANESEEEIASNKKVSEQDESLFESISSWFQSFGSSNEIKEVKASNQEKSIQPSKNQTETELKSANRENSKLELKEQDVKSQKIQDEREKKIITTNDLFAKFSQAKTKSTEESKSNGKPSQETKSLDGKDLDKNVSPSNQELVSKSLKSENAISENKETNRKSVQEPKSKNETKLESLEKPEPKDIPKITIDKMEKGETPKDMSKWEIRQEKSKQEFSNLTQSSQNKDSVVALESNSSSSSSKSQNDTSRDQGSENFKADLFRANLTKKPDSLASKSSVLDAEEMKANMDKLVQKAKIQIINEGRSQAEIRLNPMELGRMILKISVQNDKVQGKVLVDSEAVKTALQNDLSTLKEDLRAQGLDLQSLSIDVNLDFNQDLQRRQDQFAKIDNFGNRNRKESLVDIEVPKTIRVSDSLLDVIA